MATIDPHTIRSTGTTLTAAIYNEDHERHVSNAQALNAELDDLVTEANFNTEINRLENEIDDVEAFPQGTRMLFNNDTAPSGWTKETSSAYNDAALRTVNGSVSSGGNIDFSTVFGKTGTDGHTLTTSEMPSHSHTHSRASGSDTVEGDGVGTVDKLRDSFNSSNNTDNEGGSNPHDHGMDIRVRYNDMIIAEKD